MLEQEAREQNGSVTEVQGKQDDPGILGDQSVSEKPVDPENAEKQDGRSVSEIRYGVIDVNQLPLQGAS